MVSSNEQTSELEYKRQGVLEIQYHISTGKKCFYPLSQIFILKSRGQTIDQHRGREHVRAMINRGNTIHLRG